MVEEDRKLTERNALSQFRANRVLSDQLSSVQAQIEADREHAESVDLKAFDREQRLMGHLEQVRDFQGRTHRLLTEQLPELRVQIGSEAAQAAEREQRLLSRLEDRFAAEADSQRVLTEQLSDAARYRSGRKRRRPACVSGIFSVVWKTGLPRKRSPGAC